MVQSLESPGLSWRVDGTKLTALYMYLPTLPKGNTVEFQK